MTVYVTRLRSWADIRVRIYHYLHLYWPLDIQSGLAGAVDRIRDCLWLLRFLASSSLLCQSDFHLLAANNQSLFFAPVLIVKSCSIWGTIREKYSSFDPFSGKSGDTSPLFIRSMYSINSLIGIPGYGSIKYVNQIYKSGFLSKSFESNVIKKRSIYHFDPCLIIYQMMRTLRLFRCGKGYAVYFRYKQSRYMMHKFWLNQSPDFIEKKPRQPFLNTRYIQCLKLNCIMVM
ncbi:hypothetical protein BpHYR1_014829 [Brachionus plicatilis]|uniref:Uncharacterized protein n=1 Tax=Brachionus plicatilis TaxID=10195 RepID=A0A3M7QIU2_BRAPC|nr:hypothetical protein BpHYR1_014829 [Brachionus plicatilis]